MPNTLAHLGIQALTGKAAIRSADIKWIGLGCLIPDLPWITQRLLQPLAQVDPIDLRIYVVIQASLFFCLILSAAISLQVEQSRKIFFILAGNCLLHLLLDPTQIKWANGVHLLAPFSWQITCFGWFWPEQLPSLLLTLAGCVIFPVFAWQDRHRQVVFIRNKKRQTAGILLLGAYLVLPLLLISQPVKENNHFAATLQSDNRAGSYIEFDRTRYTTELHTLAAYSGEHLRLKGNTPEQDGVISIQGEFINNNTILVSKYHVHSSRRDIYSQIGIFLLLVSWLLALFGKSITIKTK